MKRFGKDSLHYVALWTTVQVVSTLCNSNNNNEL